MNSIFNSLGSGYNQEFEQKSRSLLLTPWKWESTKSPDFLEALLKKRFKADQVYLTYKGRQAITLILKNLGLGQGDEVILQAFTCWAVEEGIRNAGCKPVFADIASDSLNPSVSTLIAAFKKSTKPRAVLIQHTLGIPADIKAIKAFCAKNNLLLIEDLAHSYGATDDSGVFLGTHADAVALSFGRDKVIDAVSGGAAIIKKSVKPKTVLAPTPKTQILIDLLYPTITKIIRITSTNFFGKVLHKILKKTPLLTTPIQSTTTGITSLPSPHATLTLLAMSHLDSQLQHRKEIAKVYFDGLNNLQIPFVGNHDNINFLRFPVLVKDRGTLITYLKSSKYFIPDTWYKKPVDTGSLVSKISHYIKDSCPNAQNISEQIINLPTHINITPKQAAKLALLVNQYVSKHQSNRK